MSTTVAPEATTDLEQLIGTEQLAPCDWQHGHRACGVPCAEVAAALMWQGCTPDIKWRACEHAAAWARNGQATAAACVYCSTPVSRCWRVIPI